MTAIVRLVERPEQVVHSLQTATPGHRFISFTADADYEFERHGISGTSFSRYIDVEDYSRHCYRWRERFIALMHEADALLEKSDPRFAAAGFRPFSTCRYLLELAFTNTVGILYFLKAIFERERPQRIEIACNAPWPGEAEMTFGLLHATALQRLLPLVGNAWGVDVGLEEDAFSPPASRQRREALPGRLLRKGATLQSRWRQLLSREAGLFLSRVRPGGRCCLSVGSQELEHVSLSLLGHGWKVREADLARFEAQLPPFAPYPYAQELSDRILGGTEALRCCGVDFTSLFCERLCAVAARLEHMLHYMRHSQQHLAELRPDAVVFHTHAPLPRLAGAIWPAALRRLGIPYACWVHGLYGFNHYHCGFASTDLLLGQHYFVYGRAFERFAMEHHPESAMTFHVAGSPKLERHRKRSLHRTLRGRKTVAIILNSLIMQPGFLPLDSADALECYWSSIKAVLKTVARHTDNYAILIRPYDNYGNERVLLEKFIRDNGIENVFFSDKLAESIYMVYEKSYVNVLFWMSSSTLEACCTDADVFLYDRSDLTEDARRLIPHRIFWESDLERFCRMLDEYLTQGVLHRKSGDTVFLNEVMDLDCADRRGERTANLLNSMVEDRKWAVAKNAAPS